jgi:hypothetical protein
MSEIYAGLKGTITFTTATAWEELTAHIVEKNGRRVLGMYSYPARTGYNTLTKDGNVYTGSMLPEVTKLAATETLEIEVKAFIDSDNETIGVAEIARVKDNTLKSVQRVS